MSYSSLAGNIYQAACGSAHEAVNYLDKIKEKTAGLGDDKRQAILDGMSHEIFLLTILTGEHRTYVKAGDSRAFELTGDPDLRGSLTFIRDRLQPYKVVTMSSL